MTNERLQTNDTNTVATPATRLLVAMEMSLKTWRLVMAPEALNQGETLVSGTGHAEADIINYANQNGLNLLEIGATRPICPACAALIGNSGVKPVTPLKVP